MEGERVTDYFTRIGKRGGQTTARNRREAVFRDLPPEARMLYDHQRAVLSGQRRPTREKSRVEL